mmetsp:Transcript_2091/g.3312  ORF Transcript_2091/g.3312 Transcript_2091/m.3312 type:complete len:305 (+) Transcript_2091:186-1100(+)|eukprot:CAMPEP_0119021012 /NCGR_PEP_ID=MMETSP1176-20130426/25141_1 /TAXON_ID=265551 /ORGANISM="Synedropsis recta cf, Strain CCMP1620" /LENGTH=304 /DNA_ID=CAMNT_0006975529 /DNA_START=77 /DNA_END=991 /DNA_ORIENTATION=+
MLRARRPLALLVQRRCFSATVESATSTAPPSIVSRRAWQSYRKKNPSTAAPKEAKPKEEEKPWPRNMVLAAYAAASVFIPYSIAWFLSMHVEVRQAIGSPALDEMLRSHFGEDEHTSYQDLKNGVLPRKKLGDEDFFEARKQQKSIESLSGEEVPVEIHVYQDGGMVTTTAMLPGTKLATPDNLLSDGNVGVVAVDFEDLPSDVETTLFDGLESESGFTTESLTQQTYSSWYYQPPSDPQERRKVQQASKQDIEVTRLEYTIQLLEREIVDVNSTRDIDDMKQELTNCRSELRNLRWKRRLGMD